MADSKQYRKKFYQTSAVFLVLVTGVLMLLNLTSDQTSSLKLDLTKDRIYSISEGTAKILEENLKDNIRVTYYCSGEVSTLLGNLLRDTIDLFEEFRKLSGGKFQYEVVNPEEEADRYAVKKAEEYMVKYEAGETDDLDEPEPIQSPMAMFMQQQKKTPEEIRKERQKEAALLAKDRKQPENDVFRELLIEEWKQKYFKDLGQEQISPYIVSDRTGSSVRQVKVYSALKITYLAEQAELIPFHSSLEGLEYDLAYLIVKMTQPSKPTVVVFDGRKPEAPPMNPMQPMPPPPSDYQAVVDQVLRELFDVREIRLKEDDSVDDLVKTLRNDAEREEAERKGEDEPGDEQKERPVTDEDVVKHIQSVVIAQPDSLEPRQVYEINRLVSLGIPTVFLVSPYTMDVSEQGLAQAIPVNTISTGLEELFSSWGFELGNELLASRENGIITIQQRIQGLRGLAIPRPTPISAIVAPEGEAIDKEHSFTGSLRQLAFPATTGLKIDDATVKKNGLNVRTLARTGDESWSVPVNPFERLQNPMMRNQGPGISIGQYREQLAASKDPENFNDWIEPVTLAAYITGKFPFTFEGQAIPDWKKEPKDEEGDTDGVVKDSDTLLDPDDPLDEVQDDGAAAAQAPEDAAVGDTVEEAQAPPPASSGAAEAEKAAETKALATNTATETVKVSTPGAASEKTDGGPKAHVEVRDGKVLVLASVDMLKDGFLRFAGDFPGYRQNVELLRNAIELFGMGDTLINIRRKNLTVRQFKPGSDRQAWWVQGVNLFGIPLLVAAVGLLRFLVRRNDSIRYERRFIESQKSNA